MDGGVSTAIIEVRVQNLINILKEEYNLIQGVDGDVQQLQRTLYMIQAYLTDAEAKSSQDAVKMWLRELEALALDADSVLDELTYLLLRRNIIQSYHIKKKKKLPSCFPFSHRPSKTVRTIKQINADFESMNEKATQLGLRIMIANAPVDSLTISETHSLSLDPIFIGRDDDVAKLVEILTHLPEDRIFSIIAVVGMGGLGKTTLTRRVFNDERVKTRFGSHIWVHVSQIFDPISLLKKILFQLSERTSDGVETMDDILEDLKEALKAKTYLLVLDNVWNEDIPKWEIFLTSILGVTFTKHNGIIITTRSRKVASIVNVFQMHALNDLSDDDCWSIVKAKTFGGNREAPSGFGQIGREIAKRCMGLPLAANVVGGMLIRKSEEEWHFILENWPADGGAESIKKILKLSFDHLSSPSLQNCFAYCSVFPKGRDILKQELIELWMAEGFLQPSRIGDMEFVGNIFVNLLLQNSLLQVAEIDDYGNVWSCVMHDLVHDLASSVSSNNPDGGIAIRYMFLKEESSSFPNQHNFSGFRDLRSLILSGYNYKELPDSVRELINLRNLNISNTRIGHLPDWVGELLHLQTLRLCKSPLEIPTLPSTLKSLLNLRHLYITWNTDLPAGIGNLTCLRTLAHFRVGKEKGHRIEELGRLRNLTGKLEICNLEKVRVKNEALKAKIFMKSKLCELVLKWEASREGERNDEAVLEGLQPHGIANLKKLTIEGYQGKRFPAWSHKKAFFENLIEFTLSSCEECEEMPTLGQLPNLKHVSLSKLSNVRSINPSFYGVGVNGAVFPALESMLVSHMAELSEWRQIKFGKEVKLFPRLQSLKMHHCHKLECLPNWLFHSLSKLDLRHCPKLTKLPNEVEAFPGVESLKVHHCQKLECLPNWLFRSLSELDLRHCPKLTKLPDGLEYPDEVHAFPGLRSLKMYHCCELECVPDWLFGNTHSLYELDIRHCTKLIELSGSMAELINLEIEFDNVLPRIHSLKMYHCYKLECLPNWLFHNTDRLSELDIRHCPMLETLPNGLRALDYLEQMTIRGCRNLKSIVYQSDRGSLISLPHLLSLEIRDCQKLVEMVEPSAPLLTKVCVVELKSLQNLPKFLDCLAESPLLEQLTVVAVPQFMSSSTSSVEYRRPFNRLRKLEIDVSRQWSEENSAAIQLRIDDILKNCPSSLDELTLTGLQIWKYLPDSIQNLNSLRSLGLESFGFKALPKCFEKLSSLTNLSLSDCANLTDISSVQRLTQLEELHICDCPKLRIESERHKILSRTKIFVNGHKL